MGDYNSANQRVTRAPQVPQALPDHLDRGGKKDPEDEEDRKEGAETREIKVLWDRQERVASKASWDLWDRQEYLGLKDRKVIQGLQACRELKENLVNPFQLLLLLFLLQS